MAAAVSALAGCASSTTASSSSSSSSPADSAASAQVLPASPDGATTTTQTPPKQVDASSYGISGLVAYDTAGYPSPGNPGPGTLAHDHVTGPVSYAVTPPVGGPHAPVWMNAGIYTAAVPSERAVHDMEHGAVWITYQPSLPADQVAELDALVDRQTEISEDGGEGSQPGQANRYVVMSPWADGTLPAPIVISSWGFQLRVTAPDDPRLQKFIDTFRHSDHSPEQGAPVDGVPTQTGGVAARDGGKVANPPGAAGDGM
jgi:hypothetical protein